jgi:hypothetical protein
MTLSQNSFIIEEKTQAQGAHDGKNVLKKKPNASGFYWDKAGVRWGQLQA